MMRRTRAQRSVRCLVYVGVALMIGIVSGCSSTESDAPASGQSATAGQTVGGADADGQTAHTTHYRATPAPPVPPVLLSAGHQELCRVGVGDAMPPMELARLGGRRTKLADLYGQTATVIVFWKSDRRMSLMELADLGPDVVEPFGDQGVSVVGIAVAESDHAAQAVLRQAEATFPNLMDADGRAFAQVGSEKLPRTYLLDSQGKIVWFDIEYSLATRRELNQALRAIVPQ